MTRRNYIIAKECDAGYLHIAHPEFMSALDANRLADREYPDCHVVSYPNYKRRLDPDAR